jgi:hypothetical protein
MTNAITQNRSIFYTNLCQFSFTQDLCEKIQAEIIENSIEC